MKRRKSISRWSHKWLGLLISFFLLMFCLSGIVLNHRVLFRHAEVSRALLPQSFRYAAWNNGLVRGSVCYGDSILLYGNATPILTDSLASSFRLRGEGLPKGADARAFRSVVAVADGTLYGVTQFGLHCLHLPSQVTPLPTWQAVPLPDLPKGERLSDLTLKGDTLVLLTRSRVLYATPPYREFASQVLVTPNGHDPRVSLFKTIWMLHSGELFGIWGQLVVDLVAVVMVVLIITGWLYWLLPKWMRYQRRREQKPRRSAKLLGTSLRWHDKLGRSLIVLLLFVTITGWFLRPPAMIAIIRSKVMPLPGSRLDSPNPFHDKLRMIRYDATAEEWLLSTSEGFYALKELDALPVKQRRTPPVSVMGLNVWEPLASGEWVVGSFSGLYLWDRRSGVVLDYETRQPVQRAVRGMPVSNQPIAGYAPHFELGQKGGVLFEYGRGSDFAPMPDAFRSWPISLWHLALEVHTGRIYTFLGVVGNFYIFFAGLLIVWVLWSGYRLRLRKRGKKSTALSSASSSPSSSDSSAHAS